MKTELCKMKEVFNKIDRLQEQITELNRNAFEQLCNIIREVCSKEDEGVEKIGKRCFMVKMSALIGRPWSLDYVSNEVAGEVLLQKAKDLFGKRERVEDVLNHFREVVSSNKDEDVAYVAIDKRDERDTLKSNKRAIKKRLLLEILSVADEN